MNGDWVSYIGPIVALLGFVAGVWWRVEGKINAADDKADDVERKLADYKLHAAETFATKAGMHEQTSQILRSIESVGNRIDGLNDRLDRLYENPPRRTVQRT